MSKIKAIELETLECIDDFISEHRYPPSIRDLVSLMPINSTSVTNRRLDLLENSGLITRVPGLSRTIVITKQGRKVLDAQEKQED
jgi:repressor LexA